ncbi:unnamed protein product [Cladocopium goreaui]|uniref:Alpha N-terminal protein methyltransferase 1 (X-Pro-Lys N-terminal protein methyltransferase 1) n=1 Tax=Cladocopium goreaui TaxID=2562237 RepID=A0A9P1CBP5_9DINO|nr:unnamed protein product [Cladocopium goreaui]
MASQLRRLRTLRTAPCVRMRFLQRRSVQTWGDEEPSIFRPKTAFKTRKGLQLPEGWREITSPSKGVYYAHDSGATQFDFPKGPPAAAEVRRAQNERAERYGHRTQQLCPGATVRLIGLERFPQLEGKTGTCVQLDPDGYVRVRLDSGELKAVKLKNLMLVTPPEPSAASRQSAASRPPNAQTKEKSKSFLRLYQYYLLSEQDRTRAEQKEAAKSSPKAAGPTVPKEPLPEGWCAHLDPGTGRLYYWQEVDPSNTVTWDRPVAPVAKTARTDHRIGDPGVPWLFSDVRWSAGFCRYLQDDAKHRDLRWAGDENRGGWGGIPETTLGGEVRGVPAGSVPVLPGTLQHNGVGAVKQLVVISSLPRHAATATPADPAPGSSTAPRGALPMVAAAGAVLAKQKRRATVRRLGPTASAELLEVRSAEQGTASDVKPWQFLSGIAKDAARAWFVQRAEDRGIAWRRSPPYWPPHFRAENLVPKPTATQAVVDPADKDILQEQDLPLVTTAVHRLLPHLAFLQRDCAEAQGSELQLARASFETTN